MSVLFWLFTFWSFPLTLLNPLYLVHLSPNQPTFLLSSSSSFPSSAPYSPYEFLPFPPGRFEDWRRASINKADQRIQKEKHLVKSRLCRLFDRWRIALATRRKAEDSSTHLRKQLMIRFVYIEQLFYCLPYGLCLFAI